MSDSQNDCSWRPYKKLNWSIFTLLCAAFGLLAGVLAPMKIHKLDLGKNWFWVALGAALITALIINLLRPKYKAAHGFWKPFYEFLLKQMPPPDRWNKHNETKQLGRENAR